MILYFDLFVIDKFSFGEDFLLIKQITSFVFYEKFYYFFILFYYFIIFIFIF
jgi:hypothetical protein